MAHLTTLADLVAAIILLYAALSDLRSRTVANWVSAVLASIGLALHLAQGTLGASLLAASCVLALTLVLWAFRLMGGADAKLIPAVTTLLPLGHVPGLLLTVALSGGVLSAIYLVLRGLKLPAAGRGSSRLLRQLRREQRRSRQANALPYVVAVCAGTLIALARG